MLDNEYGTAGPPRADVRAGALAAAFALAEPGERLQEASVRVYGHEAAVVCRLDAAEHARRAPYGARRPVLADWAALNLLMGLPYEEPVPVAALTERERAMIPRLPDWTHAVHDGHIRRTARPPLNPVLAVVRANGWRTGLTKAAVYGEHCATTVVLGAGLDDPFAPMEAEEEGVGLVVDGEVLVRPDARPRRRTANTWWLAEHAYWRMGR